MRILVLAHRVPYPPRSGHSIRTYHVLTALRQRGHEVHLLALAHARADLAHALALREKTSTTGLVELDPLRARLRAAAAMVRSTPLSVAYFSLPAMHRAVRRAAATTDFDAVVVVSSTMAQYVPALLRSRAVLDLVDVDSEKWHDYARSTLPPESWLYRLEARRLRGYEQALTRRYGSIIVCSAPEADVLLRSLNRQFGERVHVVSNGVDLDYFRPPVPAGVAPESIALDGSSTSVADPLLVFTGTLDYRPNVDGVRHFAEDVLPLIRKWQPGTRFSIVGNNPVRSVRTLAALDGVTVAASVADVRPYLSAATACVVPLRLARGIQTKVLEAMASGCAVVATPQAATGLNISDNDHLLVADGAANFARAVLRVVTDHQLRDRLGRSARAFVERHHRWDRTLAPLMRLVESAASRPDQHACRG